MTRQRRDIGTHGELFCRGCETLKHISDFYCIGGPWVSVLDAEDEDTWYGRPQNRCKECVLEYQRSRRERLRATNTEEDEEFRQAFISYRKRGIRLVKRPDGTIYGYHASSWGDDDPM